MTAAAPSRVVEAIAHFEDQIANDVDAERIGGMTAAVVLGGDVYWAQGFGWADVQRRAPAAPETIYRVGSISKCLTAVVLVQLREEGVLDLDDRVEVHLPEIRALRGYCEHPAMTLTQLASHTSGLAREPTLQDAAIGPMKEWECKVLASIPTTSIDFQPGSCYSYSNIGYGILGLAISRAAEASFIDLVDDLILAPLGMMESGFFPTRKMWSSLATGYARPWGVVNTKIPFDEHGGRGYKVPNGGIYSSVRDLGRFIASQAGLGAVSILSADARALMHTTQTPGADHSGYGLGFGIHNGSRNRLMVGHEGSVAGYNAYMVFDPGSGAGVVLLRNYGNGKTDLEQCGSSLLEQLVDAV